MLRPGPVRQSRRLLAPRTVVLALLLSFGAFDVLDLDGSNLPAAAKGARPTLQEERPDEVERHSLDNALGWPTSKVPPMAGETLTRQGTSLSRLAESLPHLLLVRAVRQALPRANLASPSFLI